MSDARDILDKVANGEMTPEEAELQLKMKPFVDLGFAKPDLHRGLRQGVPEVIYGEGKTPEQIDKITASLLEGGQETVLITRLSEEKKYQLQTPVKYYDVARIGVAGKIPEPSAKGSIVVATGGTSDLPVAEEAAVTAELLGNKVERVYDVGVSGLHRLLAQKDKLMSASGLVDCPVIAVPTSVGYGASFEGLTALLAMMNSCASGVTVVNIDNGFGAGYSASMINHIGG